VRCTAHTAWGLRLVMILLSARGQSASAIAELLGCDAGPVRRWIPHGQPQEVMTPGTNRRPTSFGAVDMASGGFFHQVAAKAVSATFTAFLEQLLAVYPPHDNPIERIWGALKTHLANTPTLTIQGRIRQVHAFFRARTLNSSWPPPPRPAHCGRPTVTCRPIVRSLRCDRGGGDAAYRRHAGPPVA
jgi:hypothetical protein